MLQEIAERLLRLLRILIPEESVHVFQVSSLFLRNRRPTTSFLVRNLRGQKTKYHEGKV